MKPSQSRLDAIADGLTIYDTGVACSKGHTTGRFVYNRACVQCERDRTNRYYLNNKAATKERVLRWKRANKEKVLATQRKSRANFPSPIVNKCMLLQKSSCAICKKPFGTTPRTRPHADHNHITMMPRGLLCTRCNSMLARIHDSAEYALAMADYLTNPPAFAPTTGD